MLAIESPDKVSEIRSRSWMLSTEFLSRSRSFRPMPSETDSDILARARVALPSEAYAFRICTQVYRGT